MSEMAKIFAWPEKVEFAGDTYTVSPMTLNMELDLERILEQRAWEALKRNAMRVSNYAQQEHMLLDAIAAGDYSYGSMNCIKFTMSRPGRIAELTIMVKRNHKEFTPDIAREIIMARELEIEAMMERMNGPNSTAPTEQASESLPESGRA